MTDNMRQALRNQKEKRRISTEHNRDIVKSATSTAMAVLAAIGSIALML